MRTITSKVDIERLFREGTRTSSKVATVLVAPTPEARDQHGRVLFVAGRRIGGAVTRNRAKRVLREAARRSGAPWPGLDVALLARPTTPAAAPAEIDTALRVAIAQWERRGGGR
ncbi:MAG: ribonuclease P protein component [Aeromicrobium sp.]|jgi:ribonuclease P protein component|nr:ribonuclease P protein component [Aeromicrobium sp.]